jgi:hypothetical protein
MFGWQSACEQCRECKMKKIACNKNYSVTVLSYFLIKITVLSW